MPVLWPGIKEPDRWLHCGLDTGQDAAIIALTGVEFRRPAGVEDLLAERRREFQGNAGLRPSQGAPAAPKREAVRGIRGRLPGRSGDRNSSPPGGARWS